MSAPIIPIRKPARDRSAPLARFLPDPNVRLPYEPPPSLVPQSPEQATAEFYRHAPDYESDWPVKCEWLRKQAWFTAIEEALFDALGDGAEPPYAETLELLCEMSEKLGYPDGTAQTVLAGLWQEASDCARVIVEEAEKAVRRLVWEAAPGSRVIAAACAVFERHEAHLPRDPIVGLCARIGQSRGRRRG